MGAVLTTVVNASPVQAAACDGLSGVSVVVDFRELGGGIGQECASTGGQNAADSFTAAGFPLTRVQQQSGFVCRVQGAPASDPCVDVPPATAYWGLWWTDGTSTSWRYSSLGVDSLRVPDGGSVAFAWNAGQGTRPPSVAPVARAAAPTTPPPSTRPSARPTPKPTARPTRAPAPASSASPSRSPSTPATTAPAAPGSTTDADAAGAERKAPSRAPEDTPTAAPSTLPDPAATAGAGSEPSEPAATTSSPGAPTDTVPGGLETTSGPARAADDGLPTWVAPVLVVLVFGAATGTALLRRRRQA
ncbi:MAG: hypothetical protein LH468_12960 [Nocardioides sp.]|nr:hypothetical protein [Nocardioides sp.]